jgi:hypothetical protein
MPIVSNRHCEFGYICRCITRISKKEEALDILKAASIKFELRNICCIRCLGRWVCDPVWSSAYAGVSRPWNQLSKHGVSLLASITTSPESCQLTQASSFSRIFLWIFIRVNLILALPVFHSGSIEYIYPRHIRYSHMHCEHHMPLLLRSITLTLDYGHKGDRFSSAAQTL